MSPPTADTPRMGWVGQNFTPWAPPDRPSKKSPPEAIRPQAC